MRTRKATSVRVEVVVDVSRVSRVGALDVSRDGDAAEALGASASDLDLSARDVELRGGAGVVDGELLDADEVLAGGHARGDVDRVLGRHVPGGLAAVEGRANLLDLEPWGRSVGGGCGVDLGHVAVGGGGPWW
ncbi:unnamed protein product [Periconia digitata]|uniref:Uncharacterized protein n=1 Tax=Periconia digitata TaxID=1303443 RepID=A0A9W4UE25_9PLEO|nr:unnamed protein product [Periconia digitata]